jgi:hypothetical protein
MLSIADCGTLVSPGTDLKLIKHFGHLQCEYCVIWMFPLASSDICNNSCSPHFDYICQHPLFDRCLAFSFAISHPHYKTTRRTLRKNTPNRTSGKRCCKSSVIDRLLPANPFGKRAISAFTARPSSLDLWLQFCLPCLFILCPGFL